MSVAMAIFPNILLDKLFNSYFAHVCAQEFSLYITRVDVHVSMRLPAKLRAHFRIRPNYTKSRSVHLPTTTFRIINACLSSPLHTRPGFVFWETTDTTGHVLKIDCVSFCETLGRRACYMRAIHNKRAPQVTGGAAGG